MAVQTLRMAGILAFSGAAKVLGRGEWKGAAET